LDSLQNSFTITTLTQQQQQLKNNNSTKSRKNYSQHETRFADLSNIFGKSRKMKKKYFKGKILIKEKSNICQLTIA